jgi:YfiH family protein
VTRIPEKPFSNAGEADALVTEMPGVALAVLAADCLPILLVGGSPARAAGAVHSGWRGVVQHAVIKTIERMIALSGEDLSPSDFTVAIGPHIRQCCFEVGPEVVEEFKKAGDLADGEVKPGDGDRSYIDLTAITTRQLVALGVSADRIEAVRHCTKCRPDLFFSYRGEGPNRGMQGAAVTLEA